MQLLRILTVSLGLGAVGLAAGGANCNPVSDFQCATDEECIGQGEGGVCESNNFCTFPDLECPTGRRWHDRASSLAGMCFGDGVDTDTDTPGTSSSSGDPTLGSATETGSTTAPVTTGPAATSDATDPTTGDPSTTTGGSSSSGTGAPMGTCDELYGGTTDYMLCDEAEDSCRFNATIDMVASCDDVCGAAEGTCLGAELNEKDVCLSTGDTTCDDVTVNNLICICSRG